MVKHICICDRCGKEEKLKSVDYLLSEKMNKNYDVYDIPEGWNRFGICPMYLACSSCALELSLLHNKQTYNFFTERIGNKK